MRTLRTVLIPLLALGGAFSGCGSRSSRVAPQEREALVATTSTFQSRLSLSGALVAETSISLGAPGEGYGLMIRWMADDGSHVKKGDKVLEMDTSAVVSQIENLENAVIKANNELAQQDSTGRINLAEKEHLLRQAEFALQKARTDASVPEDAYPRRVYEDMQLALGRAKAAHVGAVEALAIEKKVSKNAMQQKRIALERSKRELRQVYEKLEGYVLHAPRDGVLVASNNWREGRAYRIGDKTWPGQPIVEIPDLSVMTIEAQLSDVDDGQVHVGMQAECRLDAYPDEVLLGHIVSISPVARKAQWDSLRMVFDVTIKLESTDPDRMRPGMSARVDVLGAATENVVVAPREALIFGDTDTEVRLATGKSASVTLGPCNPQECVVRSGLEAGTRLRSGGAR